MNRRKFIKTSMCLGCGAALLPASQSPFLSEITSKFSKDKFIYKRKEDLPKKVCIDACSLCQLNCPVCWMRLCENIFKKNEEFGYLKYDDFKNFVDDNPQLEYVELSHSGEIFLNPELDKIIEYANKKNIGLTANTGVNLNDLSEEMAELLVRCRFKELTISIDGATPDVYNIYRRGGDFNKVIANIEKINKYKKQYNSEYPKLTWKFLIFGHNEHEIELARQKAMILGVAMRFDQNNYVSYSPVKNKTLVYKKSGVNYYVDLIKNKIINENWYFCFDIFRMPHINWNGNFLGCCANYDKNFGVNVFEIGLMNALNSKQYIEAKHMLTDFSYISKSDNPCKDCCFYEYLKKENIKILEHI